MELSAKKHLIVAAAEANAASSSGRTRPDAKPSIGATYLQTGKQMAGKWGDGQQGIESSIETDRQMASLQADRRMDAATNGTQPFRHICELQDSGVLWHVKAIKERALL